MLTFFLVIGILLAMALLIFCAACLAYYLCCRQEVTERELYEYRMSQQEGEV
jgi:hypothetical protein